MLILAEAKGRSSNVPSFSLASLKKLMASSLSNPQKRSATLRASLDECWPLCSQTARFLLHVQPTDMGNCWKIVQGPGLAW